MVRSLLGGKESLLMAPFTNWVDMNNGVICLRDVSSAMGNSFGKKVKPADSKCIAVAFGIVADLPTDDLDDGTTT
jgi:hypothetical protein